MDLNADGLPQGGLEIEGSIDGVDDAGNVHGWVRSRHQPSEPLTVSVFDEGEKIAEQIACLFRKDLADAGVGDGRCGFRISLPGYLSDGASHRLTLVAELYGVSQSFGAPLTVTPGRASGRSLYTPIAEDWRPASSGGAASADVGAGQAAEVAIVFDVSDLIEYFRHDRLPTGIQRVQMEVVTNALAQKPRDCSLQISAFGEKTDRWVEIPELFFRQLCRLALTDGRRDAPDWLLIKEELQTYLREAPPIVFPNGAYIINLGTSWWLKNYFINIRAAKERSNIKYVTYVHDMIPVMTPEHCIEGLVRDFIGWVKGAFAHADRFMANSNATARDLTAVARFMGYDIAPPAIVRLDADHRRANQSLRRGDRPSPGDAALLKHDLQPGAYVLFVSTIESRKNHELALSAWLKLIKRHGIERVPMLVCVGKRGWLNDAVYARLAASSLLQRRVIMVSDISDPALENLYKGCRFSLYPSHYEGWGLPVTESLSHGKVPLVANNSSLPEAGGEFAEYFDSGSENDFIEKLERLMFDAPYRARREARIVEGFRARTWGEIAAQMLDHVREWHEADQAAPAPTGSWLSVAEPGRYYTPTDNRDTELVPTKLTGEMFRQGDGWWWPEPWGCWTKERGGRLALLFRMTAPAPLVLFVGIRGVQGKPSTATVILDGLYARTVDLRADQDKWLIFRIDEHLVGRLPRVGEHVRLEFLCSADQAADFAVATNGTDPRVAGLGVLGFMIARADDVEARVSFVESVALGDMSSLMEASQGSNGDRLGLWRLTSEIAASLPAKNDSAEQAHCITQSVIVGQQAGGSGVEVVKTSADKISLTVAKKKKALEKTGMVSRQKRRT